MRLRLMAAVSLAVIALADPGLAEDTKKGGAKKEPAKAAAPGEVRRDPKGIKGISPYNEELAKGRKAASEKSWDAAINSFSSAIAQDGSQAAGYLFKAQVHLEKGELDLALQTAEEGRGKTGSEDVHGKLTFLLGDLKERKADSPPGADWAAEGTTWKDNLAAKWSKVKDAWSAYTSMLAGSAKLTDHRASSEERKKKIDERVQRDKDYGDVRTRIIKNEKEADESRAADEQKNPEKK